MCKDENGNEISFPKETYLIFILDDLEKSKSERALRLCMDWASIVEQMHMPAYIISTKPNRIFSISYYQFGYDRECEIHHRFQALRQKTVYGKVQPCIQGTIVVMDGEKVVQINHRINENAMRQACLCALKRHHEILVKKVKKKV